MTYLFSANTRVTNEVEVKNDANSALRVNVANGGANVTTSNPFPVVVTGGNTNTQLIKFPDSATSAFGELSVTENSPDIQIDAVYGLVSDSMSIAVTGGGSAEANSLTSLFSANSGTTSGSSAQMRSRRFLRYRPGQGAIARFTAMYTLANTALKHGVDGVIQRAGFFNVGGGYGFGFSGQSANANTKTFGVYHYYDGNPEIRKLTINTAPTGTQTANITLNGVSYTVPIYSGSTGNTAAAIARGNTYSGQWQVDCEGSNVYFTAYNAGAKTGTYSFSSTGAGTLANGSYTTVATGTSVTTDWTYMQDWVGPDTVANLDPSKLNVYQVDFRWLGVGIVRFFVEDPESGELKQVHHQHWANLHTTPHVQIPSFRVGWISSVIAGASPTQAGVVKGASSMASIQGKKIPTTYSKSWSAVNSTNLNSGSIYHLLSIRNPYQKSGKLNTQELQFLDLTVSAQGNDPSVVHIFINGTPSAPLPFNEFPTNTAYYSNTVGPTFSMATDVPVTSVTVGINGTSQFDLTPYRLTLAPGDTLSVAIESTSQLTRTAVGIVWIPD